MGIKWTDMGDGFQVWLVNDRPVLIRDTKTTRSQVGGEHPLFRHDQITERVEGLYGWRVSGPYVDYRTKAVLNLARTHAMPFSRLSQVPMDSVSERMDMSELCELTGIPAYSGLYRLTKPWEGHPAGTWLVWASGSKNREGVMGAIEKRRIESILEMTVQLLEGSES